MIRQERIRSQSVSDISEQSARRLLLALIGCTTLAFSLLAYLKYAAFNSQSFDSAIFGYAFSQARHGRFFPNFTYPGGVLSQHVNLFAFIYFPFFWLVPTMYCLFLLQSLAISLAAWPGYLLTFKKTGNRLTAIIAAAALLFYPPIASQHVNQIHDDQFGLALLLFTFYFFEVGDFKKFAVVLTLTLLAKETIALPTACFSIYALVRRRGTKWVAYPAFASVGYFCVAWTVLLPIWGNVRTMMYSNAWYFNEYGKTPGEVLKHFIANPTTTIETMLGLDRLWYLFQFLVPLLLVLPFGSWAWLTSLPNISMNLLSSNYGLRDIGQWYGLFPGALLWASFVSAIPFWNNYLSRRFGGNDYSRSLCVAMLLTCIASSNVWFFLDQYRRGPTYEARRQAIAFVPERSSVLGPSHMIAHFIHRPAVQSLFGLQVYQREPNEIFTYDYVVFDNNSPFAWEKESQRKLFEVISKMPEYRLVFEHDNVLVYQCIGNRPHSRNRQ